VKPAVTVDPKNTGRADESIVWLHQELRVAEVERSIAPAYHIVASIQSHAVVLRCQNGPRTVVLTSNHPVYVLLTPHHTPLQVVRRPVGAAIVLAKRCFFSSARVYKVVNRIIDI
jgi:hypothetical protein